MSRAILAVLGLGALVLGAFSIPATAGEYYGGGYYNGGGAYRSTYYSPPRRYYGDRVVYASGYRGGYVNSYNDGYGGGERCYARRVRVGDGYGGWVWSRTRVCD